MSTARAQPPSLPAHPVVVRLSDCAPQPWANGAGITRVLAIGHLPGSTAAFDWRLSVADVTSGPFSTLPGVDRVITLADGPALTLTIDGAETLLDPLRPLRFAGEAITWGETSQPTIDFNVMTWRQTCTAHVEVLLGAGFLAAPLGCPTYVVTLEGMSTVRFPDGPALVLHQFDSVCLPTAAEVHAHDCSRIVVVRIRPRRVDGDT